MRSYRGFLLVCLLGLVITAAWWASAVRPRRIPAPRFPQGTTESVVISLSEENPPPPPVTSTDPVRIEALAAVLRRAESTPDHKCGDSGTIRLRSRDGAETELGILAGHYPEYYEYRAYNPRGYENFRVDRAAFLRALAGLGVTRVSLHD